MRAESREGPEHLAPGGEWGRYWEWFCLALFLLLPLDLLTTFGATAIHGLEAEANPVMRWLLTQSLVVLIVIHLLVLKLVVLTYAGLLRWAESLNRRAQRQTYACIEIWLAGLIGAGIFVVSNNLSVIVFGASIL